MKRIKPAQCTACGRGSQYLESEHYPTVRVCFECYHKFVAFMLQGGYADSNAFFFQMVEDSEGKGNYPYRMALHDGSQVLVMHGPSQYVDDAYTSGTWYVKVPIELESENNLNDDLDNLFIV